MSPRAEEKKEGIPVAGRELDAEIARKVMGLAIQKVRYLDTWSRPPEAPQLSEEDDGFGWTHPNYRETWVELAGGEVLASVYGCNPGIAARPIPHYSGDISSAWEVVEKMAGWRGFQFGVRMFDAAPTWEAGWFELDGRPSPGVAEGDTAPLAICLAALKAVEADILVGLR